MTQDPATEAPVCYRHPNRRTLLRCSRCERPICADCSIDATVGQRCPSCVSAEGTQPEIRARPRTMSGRTPATMTFLGLAVLFYFATGMGAGGGIYEALAQSNQAVAAGEWWRLFTPIVLHAPGFMHIAFNMYALWILGPQIERGVGSWPFAAAYLASAGVGGAFFFFLGDPVVPAVGASGAIFGLFGIWFNWALRRRNTRYGRFLLNQILVLLLINAAIPFLIRGIAWEAHLGGLVAGFAIGEAWSRVKGSNQTALRTAIAAAVGVLAVAAVLF